MCICYQSYIIKIINTNLIVYNNIFSIIIGVVCSKPKHLKIYKSNQNDKEG